MESVEKIIEQLNTIRTLPTLPVVMQRISEAVHDPNSDARTLARIIEDDPAIMARVLKVVNSALYSGLVEIGSVHQAVARLGMTAVSNLALSTSVFSAFESEVHDGFDRRAFWRHSISVGIAACVVYNQAAPHLKRRHGKEGLRLAGLLHDIGKLILDQYYRDTFVQALEAARIRPAPLFETEQEFVGAEHGRIGAWLAVKWNLSDDLVQAIRWHHEPQSASPEHWELTALCHVANYVCNQQSIGDGGDLAAPVWTQSIWKALGLSIGDMPVIADGIAEESEKSEILLALS